MAVNLYGNETYSPDQAYTYIDNVPVTHHQASQAVGWAPTGTQNALSDDIHGKAIESMPVSWIGTITVYMTFLDPLVKTLIDGGSRADHYVRIDVIGVATVDSGLSHITQNLGGSVSLSKNMPNINFVFNCHHLSVNVLDH